MKKFLPWLLVGLVLRVVLMATTLHPDIRGHNFAAYLIAQQHEVLSFYDHISRLPRTDPIVLLYHDDLFIYPPLAYLTHGFFNAVLYPLYPQDTFHLLIYDMSQTSGRPDLPWLLVLLKFPYLVADIICLILIRRLVTADKKTLVSLLWWFNPVSLYVCYMIGQFDIYICLFILLALNFTKKHTWLAPISLGLSASFKPFALLLLPFLPGNKIKNIAFGLITYILLLAPYLGSPAFKQYALLASQTDKILYAKIMVSGSQYLPLFFVGLTLLFWLSLKVKHYPVWGWFMAVLLLFYSVSNFHPQWFLWVIPFLVLAVIHKRDLLYPVLALLGLYILIVFTFEPSLNFGLFGINLSLAGLLAGRYPIDQLASLARSAFAATSLYLALSL